MEVEHITGVGLTTRRSSQKKRHLTVCHGLLGKIVVDDECVLSIVAEILSDGAFGVGGQELKRGGFRSCSSDNDGILEAVLLLEESDDVSDSRSLLADGDVDAVETL